MHGDLVVTDGAACNSWGLSGSKFLLSGTITQTSCRQPASLETQESIANSPLHSTQGAEEMHRPVQHLCGTAPMHVEEVTLGEGLKGGGLLMGLCLHSTNLRLLREENLGLAARGILRKDRLR